MKKRSLLVLVVGVLSVGFLFAVVYATQPTADTMTMNSKVYPKHTKTLVTFSHKKHNVDYKIACTECHHVYDGEKNTFKEGDPVQKCSECHDAVKSEGKVKKLMLAFHKNCQGCHKELKKAGKTTGPTTKCNDCHAKKK